ncbi:MAG: DUF4395 family protein [Pirellulales bacterium]
MWQPRLMGILVLIGLGLQAVQQAGPYFLALSAILWWNVLFPSLNPFDALYNQLVARRRGLPRLTPAPGPRRFAQGMAATFMLAIGLLLWFDQIYIAWAVEAMLVGALGALILGGFCMGSYFYWLFTRHADFANRTLPWSRAE